MRLGKVFSSVITGNPALLGVATGQHDAALALNGGLALAGYTDPLSSTRRPHRAEPGAEPAGLGRCGLP